MMNRKEQLAERLSTLGTAMATLTAKAEQENRAMTAEEQAEFDGASDQFAQAEREIANLDRVEQINARLASPTPRLVQPTDTTSSTPAPRTGAVTVTGGTQVAHGHANHGFTRGMGEFLMAVRSSAVHNRTDPRLMVNTITTFGGETVGADGGWLLPPAFSQGVQSLATPTESVLNFLNPVQTSSNLLVVPTDEDAPWSTAAITAAKTAEGGTITASKPVIKKLNVVIHAVRALVHVSEESLSDIPFLASYVSQKMGEKLRWKMENYVVNGTGEDEPLGIINAPGRLDISDADSTATTIGAVDIFSMAASALPGSGAFWLVSPTVLPQIWSMKTGTAGYPLFVPDMAQTPNGTLLGKPIVVSEACKNLNTTGDIFLVVPNGYVLAFNGGVNTVSTIAFGFDAALNSFRATARMGGAPTLSAKVLRANAATYASNIVTLTGGRS